LSLSPYPFKAEVTALPPSLTKILLFEIESKLKDENSRLTNLRLASREHTLKLKTL